MPIISDPYSDQRNTLTQSLMKQAMPGFLRQLSPGSIPGYGRTDFEGGGTGSGGQMMRGMPPGMLQQSANRPSGDMSPALTQQVNAQPGMMPGTVPSAQPQMNPGLSMPPPQPPQQMMPLSPPAPDYGTAQGTYNDVFGGAGPLASGGGTSAGSKGASAQPPAPVASMKAGI